MAYVIGIVLVVLGLVVIAFGDKLVQEKGGLVLKVFSARSRLRIFLVKWAFGLVCIWFGLMFLFGGFKP